MNVFRRGDPTDIRNVRKLAECVFGKSWEAKTDSVYTEGGREGARSGVSGIAISILLGKPNSSNHHCLDFTDSHVRQVMAISRHPTKSCSFLVD